MEAKDLRIGNLVNYNIVDSLDDRKQWLEESLIDASDLLYLEKHPNDTDFKPIHGFVYGMAAGTAAWTLIYPQDRIKTHIQSNDNLSIRTSIQHLIRSGNIYKGFHYALLRAIPLHATAFTTMEYCQKYISLK